MKTQPILPPALVFPPGWTMPMAPNACLPVRHISQESISHILYREFDIACSTLVPSHAPNLSPALPLCAWFAMLFLILRQFSFSYFSFSFFSSSFSFLDSSVSENSVSVIGIHTSSPVPILIKGQWQRRNDSNLFINLYVFFILCFEMTLTLVLMSRSKR